jgi:hypothetical protein
VKAAYADPPYFGLSVQFYGHLHPEAAEYDKLETHAALIERLNRDYDAWAMSLHSPSLKDILPLCPRDCRVAAWVKPFASFKPGVNPGYAWEPVIFRGARAKRARTEPTVRDFCSCNITLRKGLGGAKPAEFCRWVFELLGLQAGDTLDDLFPGTGVVGREWEKYRAALSREPQELVLFGD